MIPVSGAIGWFVVNPRGKLFGVSNSRPLVVNGDPVDAAGGNADWSAHPATIDTRTESPKTIRIPARRLAAQQVAPHPQS